MGLTLPFPPPLSPAQVSRLGYVEEEPDEILGEKPYLHCLGMGADDDLDGADVRAYLGGDGRILGAV
eukprot:scaffold1627_cov126-Isochrysis_galbana.AAC.4